MSDCNQLCRANVVATPTEMNDCLDNCETEVLLQSENISDCNNIEKISNDLVSKDVCITQKAVDHDKPEYCKEISETEQKDACYFHIAEAKKDKSFCNNMSDPDNKAYCQTMSFNEE